MSVIGVLLFLMAIISYTKIKEPQITVIDPKVGNPGDILTLYGNNFGNEQAESFVEVGGTVTGRMLYPSTSGCASGAIIHLAYDAVANNALACAPTNIDLSQSNTNGRISKIYVGPGVSQAGDEAILNMYLANSAWSSYSSKLATWWSYSGIYKD